MKYSYRLWSVEPCELLNEDSEYDTKIEALNAGYEASGNVHLVRLLEFGACVEVLDARDNVVIEKYFQA